MLAINIVLLLQLAPRVSGGEGVMLYQYWSSRASSHSDTETRGPPRGASQTNSTRINAII